MAVLISVLVSALKPISRGLSDHMIGQARLVRDGQADGVLI